MNRYYRLALAVMVVLSTGCFPILSQKNRPGEGEIREPPPQMSEPEYLVPDDPGGWFISAGLAPTLEIGATFGTDDRLLTTQRGWELRVGGGRVEQTGVLLASARDTFRFLLTPKLIVGWLPYSSQDSIPIRLYAEAGTTFQFRNFILTRLSVGPSLDPASKLFGAQATVKFFETYYLRGHGRFDGSWSMMVGMTIIFPSFIYLRRH